MQCWQEMVSRMKKEETRSVRRELATDFKKEGTLATLLSSSKWNDEMKKSYPDDGRSGSKIVKLEEEKS